MEWIKTRQEETKRMAFWLPVSTIEKIKKRAASQGKTASAILREILKKHLQLEAQAKLGEILKEMDIIGRGGGDIKSSSIQGTRLSDIGITKKESHIAQLIEEHSDNKHTVARATLSKSQR